MSMESYRRTTLLLYEDHLTVPVETVATEAHRKRSHIHIKYQAIALLQPWVRDFFFFFFFLG